MTSDCFSTGNMLMFQNNKQCFCFGSLDQLESFNARLETYADDFYFVYNGRKISDISNIENGIIHIVPRLRGGKGGFGSMLRAIGAQIEKTTNREACRDLSGRRLRDINEEKRLKKWIAEQADREREAAEKKKKKLEKLCSDPKHDFQDSEYDKFRSEMVEKVHNAVEEGLKNSISADVEGCSSSHGTKRKHGGKEKSKGMFWIDGDDLPSSASDTDDEEEEEAKRLKI